MHIYLKRTEELAKKIVINPQNADFAQNTLFGATVWDYNHNPYLEKITDDFDVLNANPILKPFFLKAVSITFPKYYMLNSKSVYLISRSYGLYSFGKAKAELIPSDRDKNNCKNYCLKMETSSWEGISDMKELQKRLWAGTIAPTVIYDRAQVKQHLLQTLKELVRERNLSSLQRFYIALRLTVSK